MLLAALIVLAPRTGLAQTSLQIPLQFDFLNPGAKSLAVGGAFAGLADDATATFANPAGLTQLGASEVSVEFRGSWVTTQFLQAGRLSGTVTNIGDDTIAGAVFGDSSGSHFGVGFAAGVYTHPSHRWVIAGYRHELARVDQTVSVERRVSNGRSDWRDVARCATGRRPPGQHHGLRRVRLVQDLAAVSRGSRFCRVYIRHELGVPPLRYRRVFRRAPS